MFAMHLPTNHHAHASQDDNLAAQDNNSEDDNAVQDHVEQRDHDSAGELSLPDVHLYGTLVEYGGGPDAV